MGMTLDLPYGKGTRMLTFAALTVPGRWAQRTLCAQAGPDLVPGEGQHAVAKTATRICWQGPVRVQCLDCALSGADTWGGTTPQERDRLRQQRKAVAA